MRIRRELHSVPPFVLSLIFFASSSVLLAFSSSLVHGHGALHRCLAQEMETEERAVTPLGDANGRAARVAKLLTAVAVAPPHAAPLHGRTLKAFSSAESASAVAASKRAVLP